jgi:hypothetical protein
MKRALLIPILILASSCAGRGSAPVSTPGHGALSIDVIPNPIVATHARDDMYSFPFEVVLRETGGRPVDVSRVTATVFALGGIRLGTESYDAAEIRRLGYSPRVPAYGELRYRFTPQRSVPDERLFGGVTAELRVEGVDDTGTPTTAATSVSVRRQ